MLAPSSKLIVAVLGPNKAGSRPIDVPAPVVTVMPLCVGAPVATLAAAPMRPE
ncbi:hypothetical protein [Polynucleobacter sp. UB-Tiil-W10]|uniref:hypothetical protein n=1 Tax=Polynucleobacter sp. UB-Tiil-W10 TaxID=1855648 RepID=UPI001C0AA773|nr:hypothetical protein [Polynucleobacter sp. UB-Tiil-W10]MBU3539858.1 hypothetical protein [Polynucleobacter sp. UB-Tiil-W10]